MKSLVVIPLYNEADTIEEVFAALCCHYQGDVLIVDDGSTDGSLERIHRCGNQRLHVIRHDVNEGYGASLIDGFSFAASGGYDVVITMDCDLQHLPQQVPEFLRSQGKADIISGSRYLRVSEGDVAAPPDRIEINQIITEEVNRLTDYSITDAFCGFKSYRVIALQKLSLTERGYGFPLQFWIQAWGAGLTVAEIPVTRIYKNVKRSFGVELDDPQRRLQHYRTIIERELRAIPANKGGQGDGK